MVMVAQTLPRPDPASRLFAFHRNDAIECLNQPIGINIRKQRHFGRKNAFFSFLLMQLWFRLGCAVDIAFFNRRTPARLSASLVPNAFAAAFPRSDLPQQAGFSARCSLFNHHRGIPIARSAPFIARLVPFRRWCEARWKRRE
jgi:hypothetical protein